VQSSKREHWWDADKDTVHERVFAMFKHLDESQSHHREANLHHLRQYSNRIASGLTGHDYSVQDLGERLKINVIKSVIDAAVAQNATNKPRPMYLTERGNFSLRTRAKRLGKFVLGQFYAMDIYNIALDVFADACIFGTGFLKVYEVGGRIQCERVFPNEIVVDDTEALYGEPRQLFQHKQVDRQALAGAFPKFRDEIETSELIRDAASYTESQADPLSAVEAWHLPSAPGAKDGKHVLCVNNAPLVVEPWLRDGFPFGVFRLTKSPLGFFGIGMAEELTPIQVEINYLLQKIQMIANNLTNSLWVRKNEGSVKLSNKINGINYYMNTPPVALAMGQVPPELLSQVQYLEAKAYQVTGVSQLSATSQKPAGLNSGEALKTYNDIGSQRFQHVGQRWEHFHVRQVAELILDCAREIEARGDGDLAVLAQGDKDVEALKFSDVSIERDKYVTKAWPVSLFPDTPAGKLDTIEKLSQISPEVQRYIMPLLDFPDFEAVKDRINAPFALVEKQIEAMLERGVPQTPLPFMNHEEAQHQGALAILEAEKDGAPDERIELLRQWMTKLDHIFAAQEAAAVPPAPPLAAPSGPAMPPEPMAGAMPPMM
jgi:hypothetical protein